MFVEEKDLQTGLCTSIMFYDGCVKQKVLAGALLL